MSSSMQWPNNSEAHWAEPRNSEPWPQNTNQCPPMQWPSNPEPQWAHNRSSNDSWHPSEGQAPPPQWQNPSDSHWPAGRPSEPWPAQGNHQQGQWQSNSDGQWNSGRPYESWPQPQNHSPASSWPNGSEAQWNPERPGAWPAPSGSPHTNPQLPPTNGSLKPNTPGPSFTPPIRRNIISPGQSLLSPSSNSSWAGSSEMGQPSTKKKRGRPFGSKNKPKLPHDANPLDSQQSLPALPKASPKKLRRVSTEEVGVNTSISLHVNSEVTLRAADDDPPLPVFTFLPPAVMKGKKIIGPYVKVDTNKTKQPMYSIVNVRKKAEEDKGQPKNMTANSQARTLQRRPSFIGAAKKRIIPNLANNDTSRDSSWVCTLCKNGPHHRELGDLYGPYSIRLDRLEEDHPSSNDAQRSRNSRSPRRKNSIDGEKSDRNKTDYDQQQEIWFHEDCISWSSGVYLIGSRMNNMEETIKDSLDTVCTRCSLNGANLGCLQKGCSSRFHFLCAKDQGCDMDEDNFLIFCPKHKHATSPPTIL